MFISSSGAATSQWKAAMNHMMLVYSSLSSKPSLNVRDRILWLTCDGINSLQSDGRLSGFITQPGQCYLRRCYSKSLRVNRRSLRCSPRVCARDRCKTCTTVKSTIVIITLDWLRQISTASHTGTPIDNSSVRCKYLFRNRSINYKQKTYYPRRRVSTYATDHR